MPLMLQDLSSILGFVGFSGVFAATVVCKKRW